MYGTNYYRVIPVYSIEINMKGKHNSFKTSDVNFTTNTVLILGQKEGLRSNIVLYLREKPKGTLKGKGIYLMVYPKSSPIT